jgi:hypothetical protein
MLSGSASVGVSIVGVRLTGTVGVRVMARRRVSARLRAMRACSASGIASRESTDWCDGASLPSGPRVAVFSPVNDVSSMRAASAANAEVKVGLSSILTSYVDRYAP